MRVNVGVGFHKHLTVQTVSNLQGYGAFYFLHKMKIRKPVLPATPNAEHSAVQSFLERRY